jgi:transglutaminase-like putative cysteine protease
LPPFALALLSAQPYLPESLDLGLLASQIMLTPENRDLLYASPPASIERPASRQQLAAMAAAACAAQPRPLAQMLALTRWCSRIPLDFPSPEHSTAGGYYGDFSAFMWGGSEETIVAKGSPWPQELARVLAALAQMAGIPSRLVFLHGEQPPLLHAVAELWVDGGWAVCDPSANRCYLWPHRGYASALDLLKHPGLVDLAPEHGRNRYVDSRLYRTIAIAAYTPGVDPAPASDLSPAGSQDLAALQAAARDFQEP